MNEQMKNFDELKNKGNENAMHCKYIWWCWHMWILNCDCSFVCLFTLLCPGDIDICHKPRLDGTNAQIDCKSLSMRSQDFLQTFPILSPSLMCVLHARKAKKRKNVSINRWFESATTNNTQYTVYIRHITIICYFFSGMQNPEWHSELRKKNGWYSTKKHTEKMKSNYDGKL